MSTRFLIIGCILEGGLLVLAAALGYLVDTPPFEHAALDLAALLYGAMATLLALLAVAICARSDAAPIRRLFRLVEEHLVPLVRGAKWHELAALSVLAGVGEEALFRGVVQVAVANATTPAVGLVIASALFGIGHALSREYAVFAALFGLYLGGLMLLTDNLLPPIIAHTAYDFVVLWWLARRRTHV